jgi:penicillin-binding protein 1A
MSLPSLFVRRPLLALVSALAAAIIGGGFGFLFALYHDLPSVRGMKEYRPNVVTRILDRERRPLAELFREKRIWIPYRTFPPRLIDALTAVEDDRFFDHGGVRMMAILRALAVDVRKGKMVQGGSTITQQLAKQLFLSPDKTIVRKIREALLAIEIEKTHTKEEILELYGNQIYLGSGAYGFEAAARVYFGKSVAELTLAETATLAGLPKAPSRYSPFNNRRLTKQRRDTVLSRMREVGKITEAEERAARAEPVVTLAERGNATGPGRYFVEMVRTYLEERYGSDRVYRDGLTVVTTLDLPTQEAAETAFADGLARVGRRMAAARLYADDPQPEGALVALQPADGAILALVGGSDYDRSQFNRATQARRQPGSAFKPFVYLAALTVGYSPADIVVDAPVIYDLPGVENDWKPANFGHRFHGPVTLRTALAESMNVAAVKLLDKTGVDNTIGVARRLGVTADLAPNLTLALGASAVTPLEMTAAYAAVANGGIYAAPYFVASVVTADGEPLEEHEPLFTDAVRPEEAYVLTKMLVGVVENGTGKEARRLQRPAAAKTGTTDDYRDAWFVGFTPQVAAGVWIGLDDNRSLGRGETGGRAAAPIWTDFMIRALAGRPVVDFSPPDGVTVKTVDRVGGKLATVSCDDTINEVFVAGTEPAEYCRREERHHNDRRF